MATGSGWKSWGCSMPYDKPLSYSGLSLFRECPARFHHTYVLGNREGPGPAAKRGLVLHEKLEAFFKGEAPYPASDSALAPWRDMLVELKELEPDAEAEGEFCLDSNWQPVHWDAPEAFFRGKWDLLHSQGCTLYIKDWKSGGEYASHEKQGQAYVAANPNWDEYVVEFFYLDQPLYVKKWTYDSRDQERFKQEYHSAILEVKQCEDFVATPGDHCNYCPLSWRRGGDCKRAR